MTTQEIVEPSVSLEVRVNTLETELAQIKLLLSKSIGNHNPWWLNIVGSFQNDPNFDEAIKFGQEWRKSAE